MEEVLVKSHLIIKDIHEEFHMDWFGRLIDAKPKIENGKPVFILVGGNGRAELNTVDVAEIERIAKVLTNPKGRKAVSTDKTRIYLLEEDGNNKLMGILTHDRIKKYAPMYDPVWYR